MAVHSHHPNETPNGPVLFDDCRECEFRAKDPAFALAQMSSWTFRRAWDRAAKLQREGLPDAQHAELLLLHTLTGVQLQLERLGVPLGALPVRAS